MKDLFTPEETHQLTRLDKEFNLTWIDGKQSPEELIDTAIAQYINSVFDRLMVKQKPK